MNTYELQCRYDSRNSFYGKAWVHEYRKDEEDATYIDLQSYNTIVARIIRYDNGTTKYLHFGKYSQTTSRHQKELFNQYAYFNDEEYKKLVKEGEYEEKQ